MDRQSSIISRVVFPGRKMLGVGLPCLLLELNEWGKISRAQESCFGEKSLVVSIYLCDSAFSAMNIIELDQSH